MSADFFVRLDRAGPDWAGSDRAGPDRATVQVGPWQVQVLADDGAMFTQPARGLHLVLKGSVYGATPGALLELYARYGTDFPRHVEGAYAALILDERAGRVLVVTDRVGSYTVSAAHDGDCVLLSTRPDWAPLRGRPLSMAGISSVLTKGNLIGGLSLYQGVSTLRRACVHEVGGQGLDAHEYWRPMAPDRLLDRRPVGELEAELAELLRAAVRRRLAVCGPRVYLALSGGYDSRGLLSVMAETGREFRSFSYTLPARTAGSDAQMAARLAAQYGVQHTFLTSYRGDLPAHLRRNVAWGGGGAPLCDEVDAWAEFAALHPTDVFVGDEAFHLSGHPLTAPADQLLWQKMPPADALSWLRGALPGTTHDALRDSWAATRECVLRQAHAGGQPGPYELEFAMMLDVNVAHSLLAWRDRYAGQAAQVHTPYLDGAVLDFIGHIPLELLAGKSLFTRALRRLDPQLMRVPLARAPGYVPDWGRELIRQRGAVWQGVLAHASPLDDLIPPDVIHTLLMNLSAPGQGEVWRGRARRSLGVLRRTPLGLRVLGPAAIRRPVDPVTVLRRLLVLRQLTAAEPAGVGVPGLGQEASPARSAVPG